MKNKKIYKLFLIIAAALNFMNSNAQIPFNRKNTNVGRIGLSLSNAGTIGLPTVKSNTQGPPSMSYPRGTGIEHLFEAGIWIGAQVNGQARVSTSAFDASSGYTTGGSGFEFSPISDINEKSKLTRSPNYSTKAISHQDFTATFSDSFVVVPGTTIPISGHTNPLKAVVKMESYAWNYSYADYFVICNYTITNHSSDRWDSVWMGNWSDLVVRNVNITRDAGSTFFSRGRNGLDRNQMALYAYLADNRGLDYDFTQSYGAVQFLGMEWRNLFFNPKYPEIYTSKGFSAPQVHFNFWQYNGVNAPWLQPGSDLDRYNRMTQDVDSASMASNLGPVNGIPSNWIQLLSAGPIVSVNPGESFQYTVAFVCAKQKDPQVNGYVISSSESDRVELVEHLKRCRSTYIGEDLNENGVLDIGEDLNKNNQLDRYVLPEPPNSPRMKIIPGDHFIDVYWDADAENSIDPVSRQKDFEGYRLYVSRLGDDMKLSIDLDSSKMIGQWDIPDNLGINNGLQSIKLNKAISFNGDTTTYQYYYRIPQVSNGWQYLVSVVSFDKGDDNIGIPPLESSFTENELRAFAGSDVNNFSSNEIKKHVGVYPNPYNTSAAWDGNTSRTHKIYFNHLPEKCEITIYTSSGDVIATLQHQAQTYQGEDIRWYSNYSINSQVVTSGGEHAWDLLTESKTQITPGVYMFSVKDLNSGNIDNGNFVILK